MQLDENEIGRRIRAARRAAGLTQDELAEIIGSSKWVIHRMETGSRPPTTEECAALGDVLGGSLFLAEVCAACSVGRKRWPARRAV